MKNLISAIVPPHRFNYELSDISVIIPHIHTQPNRLRWFIPQYVSNTPREVLENTFIAYDEGDTITEEILRKYSLKGVVGAQNPSITGKTLRALEEVKTRLCVRVHNDLKFLRPDWASAVVDYFNADDAFKIIGEYVNENGMVDRDMLIKAIDKFPFLKKELDEILIKPESVLPAPFLTAYFWATQSCIFKTVYPMAVSCNDNKAAKEDSLMTLFAAFYNVRLDTWKGSRSYMKGVGHGGDFTDEEVKVL